MNFFKLNGKEVFMPKFNFVEGKQQEEIKIGAVTNEELTKFLKKYKIIK